VEIQIFPDGSRIDTKAAYGIEFQNEYKEHNESGRVTGNQDNYRADYRAELPAINRSLDIVTQTKCTNPFRLSISNPKN
jgi:hypothetical protein